ncbi:FAD:protein FMN transferase [Lacipirellula sp.]|uniref:FAD:protein FMN transferase n=1 Tax=Lacipirellula sp. TaxID=2691419 RepID=UPI003D0A4CF4
MKSHFAAAFLLFALIIGKAAAQPPLASLAGPTMGTTYHIKYWGDQPNDPPKVKATIDELLAEFDRQMSTYRDDSELSQFNRAAAGEWFPVSADTARVVEESLRYYRDTNGVLDVTVPPLLRLWNFSAGAKRDEPIVPPTDEAIAAAQRLAGSQHVQARLEPPALHKDLAGIEVDLSSIAPGYAVDLIIAKLQDLGFANAMVEIGGEVRAVGLRPDGKPWRIGVEQVDATDGTLARIVPLHDMALSTAGDYRNFRTADGGRFTHIIDPRTGRALPYVGASVTVVAKTCTEADALDTPLLIMGPDDGYEWCVEHKIAALFQTRAAAGAIVTKSTQWFDDLAPSNIKATGSAGGRTTKELSPNSPPTPTQP